MIRIQPPRSSDTFSQNTVSERQKRLSQRFGTVPATRRRRKKETRQRACGGRGVVQDLLDEAIVTKEAGELPNMFFPFLKVYEALSTFVW